MKLNLGIRSSAILLFLGLYMSSIIVINSYFIKQQENIGNAFKNVNLDESFSQLEYRSDSDKMEAALMATKFRESMAAVEIIQNSIHNCIYYNLLQDNQSFK